MVHPHRRLRCRLRRRRMARHQRVPARRRPRVPHPFINNRGDEQMGGTWNYLDITPLGRRGPGDARAIPRQRPTSGGTGTTASRGRGARPALGGGVGGRGGGDARRAARGRGVDGVAAGAFRDQNAPLDTTDRGVPLAHADPDSANTLRRMVNSYQVSQAIHVAASLGIADLLADASRERRAGRRDRHHAAHAYRLLRALASLGVLHETEGHRFELAPLGGPLRSERRTRWPVRAALVGRALLLAGLVRPAAQRAHRRQRLPPCPGTDIWSYRSAIPKKAPCSTER